ncbi:hypothetical protein MKX03_032535 [Papaver bracteatum]|nr:hypothetical protein MKX03_032535 [Papaver bracteatum]
MESLGLGEVSKVFHNDVDNNRPSSSTSKSNIRNGQETSVSDSSSEGNSPIEKVALTVPINDDPTLPVLTFRIWVLGTLACVLLSFLNQFSWYRKEPLSITSISAQIAVVPLGHLMASTITDRVFFKGNKWEFTLNPGPFNVKEHVLITIFANSGAGNKENRGKSNSGGGRGLTRNQFCLIALVCRFACLLPFSRIPFSNADFSFLDIPWFATPNIAVGFVFVMYVINPITYWLNIYDAKTFPIFSDGLFSLTGQKYISAVVDSNFRLDVDAYERIGPLRISTSFAMTYGISFACLTSTIVHVLLFHGWVLTKGAMQEKNADVHTRLMRRYKVHPLGEHHCHNSKYVIGYTYPERPVANMCFKGTGASSMQQGLAFLEDFKLGHYMKIPPRTMFMAQVMGTLVSAVVHLGTAWWVMETVPDICDRALLPAGSPWTCPSDHVFYDASVIWGLVGPRRIFGDLGSYSAINWFFLAGAVAPLLVWLAHKTFPSQQWIRLITVPVLLDGMANMPPATAVNYTSCIFIAFLSGFVAYRYHRNWWKRHNYVLSGALDAGLAFMAVLLHAFLGSNHIRLDWWGASSDGCSLASCPRHFRRSLPNPLIYSIFIFH